MRFDASNTRCPQQPGEAALNLLIVGCRRSTSPPIVEELHRHGIRAVNVQEAKTARTVVEAGVFDLMLLDLDLPEAGGYRVLAELRSAGVKMPVITTGTGCSAADRIRALDMGADTFLPAPPTMPELLAHIRAVTRRAAGSPAGAERLVVGGLEIHAFTYEVFWHGRRIDLTSKEFEILETLLRCSPRVLSPQRLHDLLYAGADAPGSNSTAVYVHQLRRKITKSIVITVRGKGYKLGSAEQLAAVER